MAGVSLARTVEAVPLTRLDFADPELFADLLATVERVASAGAFTGGEEVAGFEREFAGYCGAEYAVGVSSGTDAIALALRGLGIGAGNEVVLPTNSFIATAEAVSLTGATPRPVDVDPDTDTLTAEVVEQNLTERTRCVIPVHLYGRTAELEPIVELASARGLFVVEDACQSHGAIYQGRRVGSIGTVGCFSFYPAKNLGAWGDGGAVVTGDSALAERIRLLRSHGESPRNHHRLAGTTARLDALQAAILRVKLRRLDEWNDRRREIAAHFSERLDEAPIELPREPGQGQDHVFHQYVVKSDDRDRLREYLQGRGIATGIHYPTPIHNSRAYAHLGLRDGDCPVAERSASRCCSLPISPFHLDEEVEWVAEAIRDFATEEL